MNILYACTLYFLVLIQVVNNEIMFEWLEITETIGGKVCKFRATSFEYTNHKFYLTLVDKDKDTPGIGYVAWFTPSEDPTPILSIHGEKDDYRLFNTQGEIMAPMLVREDPCGDIWVMDANMHGISGRQNKKTPVFHIYEYQKNKVIKHKFRDGEWGDKFVFMNIAFEVHHAKHETHSRCRPLVAYLASAHHFNIGVYHYSDGKHSHPFRTHNIPFQELPSGYHHFLRGRKLEGIEGFIFVRTRKFGPLLLFHVVEGTTEYVIPLEDKRNKSNLLPEDIRIAIEKGPLTEAGRTAYDNVTGTLFFAEVKTRNIGVLNLETALHEAATESVYKRFDIGITDGVITDMKVIGRDLWVLSSSKSKVILQKEDILEMVNDRKRSASIDSPNALCELLECKDATEEKSTSCTIYFVNLFLLITCSFILKIYHNNILL